MIEEPSMPRSLDPDDPAPEIEALETEHAVLLERLAAIQEVARERDRRIADLRLALFMLPRPAPARQPLARPVPAAPPGTRVARPGLRTNPPPAGAAEAPTSQTEDVLPSRTRSGKASPRPAGFQREYWRREAEYAGRPATGVWETFEEFRRSRLTDRISRLRRNRRR